MPFCSVVICKNQSQHVNYKDHGVTYHLFPSEPNIKEKWINACGKGPNWFPVKRATICSCHFEENCFQPIKRRRLFDWAVPSMKLRLMFAPVSENCSDNESDNCMTSRSSIQHQINKTCQESGPSCSLQLQHNPLQETSITETNIEDTASQTKMRTQLNKRDILISKQKKQINQLKKKVFRYKKKVAELKEMLNEFQIKNLITSV